MSLGERLYESHQIDTILIREFSAPLIITTVGSMMYGFNCHQFVVYLSSEGRQDPFLTKLWVLILMSMDSASSLYQVYLEWNYGVTGFTEGATGQISRVNGNVVVLYSAVVVLVQFFWIAVLDGLLPSPNKWITIPIGVGSFCSFILAIVVGVLSSHQVDAFWPHLTTSIFLRSMLGLDLGVDLAILAAIIIQFNRMRKEVVHLNRTFSKLSWIFCISSSVNTLAIVGELIINAPSATNSFISITITLASIISQLYTFSMLSILNSRGELRFEDFESSTSSSDINENQRPQMNFTNDITSDVVAGSQAAAQSELSREQPQFKSGLNERKNQRRFCKTRLETFESQVQSTEVGVQTV